MRMPLVNLIWLFWLLISPWLPEHPDLRQSALTYASVAVFLLLYARAWFGPRGRVGWNTAAIALLGLAILPVNAAAWSYTIYASWLLPFCGGARVATRAAIRWLALMLTIFFIEARYLGMAPLEAVSSVVSCVGMFLLCLFLRLNAIRDAELRLSHDEIRRLAAMAERERISRDLHDLLGHTLSLVAIKSDLAGKLLDRDPGSARGEIHDIQRVARDALAQVRTAVTGIRAADFTAELASSHLLMESSGVRLSHRRDELTLPPEIETGLALILREAVTNVHRHAHARNVEVSLNRDRDSIILSVKDDGRGAVGSAGNGIDGMHARARALGGKLSIDSPAGQGTLIVIRLPLMVPPRQHAVAHPQAEDADLPDKAA